MIEGLQAEANIELMKSQAEKNKAEAEKIKGVDTEQARTNISSMLQDINNKKALEIGQRIENEIQATEERLRGKTLEEQLDVLQWTSKKLEKEVDILNSEDYVSYNTRELRVKAVKQDLANAYVHQKLMESNIEVNSETIKKFIKELEQRDRDLDIKDFEAELKSKYPSIMNVGGTIGNDIVNGIRKILGGGWAHDQRKK